MQSSIIVTDAKEFIRKTFAHISPALRNTQFGQRFVRSVPSLGFDFWSANSAILKPLGVGVSKNPSTGKWDKMSLWTDPANDPFTSIENELAAPKALAMGVKAVNVNVGKLSGVKVGNMELYVYQADAINAVIAEAKIIESGACGVVVAPTGAGKTIIASGIADRVFAGDIADVVIIVDHRLDLSRQNAPKIGATWVEAGSDIDHLVIRKGSKILASAQILQREENFNRLLEKIGPNLHVFVIFDEAHHYVAETWGALLDKFTELGYKFVGLTATPFRSDKKSVIGAFGKIIYKITYAVLWAQKRLAPALLRYIDTTVEVKVRKTRDDIDVVEIKGEDNIVRSDVVINTILERDARGENGLSPKMRALLFAMNLDEAENILNALNGAGVPTSIVSYKVGKGERQDIYAKFHDGRIRVLVNYEVLTEGFDEPAANVIFFARPTTSEKVAIQCIGRGLRIDPANPDKKCEVVMFADKIADADDPDAIIEGIDVSNVFTGVSGEDGNLADLAVDADEHPLSHIRNAGGKVGPKDTTWFRVDGRWFCFVGMANSYGTGKRYVLVTITETPNYKEVAKITQWRIVKTETGFQKVPLDEPREWTLDAAPSDNKMFVEALANVSLAGKQNFEKSGISPARNGVIEREYGSERLDNMSAGEKLFRLAVHFNEITI